MLERIQKLNNSSSAFGTLMKQFSKQEIKLNSTEEAVVTKAIKDVGGLRSALKRQMVKARVIDLTRSDAPPPLTDSRDEAVIEKKEERIETFNHKLVQVKETVNEAMAMLFSKDSKLRKISKQTEVTADPEQSNTNEIKIGEIKLRGKVKIPQRKVILNSEDQAELRRNLSLFQS